MSELVSKEDNYSETIDPHFIAENLVNIDNRLEQQQYRLSDLAFLYEVAEIESYEGLREYSDELIETYHEDLLEDELQPFEEYRDPAEYLKSLMGDVSTLISKSYIDESGIEFFDGRGGEMRDRTKMKTFKLLSTNIGREVALNFMKYKPRGPLWDIMGAGYGFFKGARMEIEERDIQRRYEEIMEEMNE